MNWPTKDGKSAKIWLKNVDFTKDIKDSPIDHGFNYFFGISGSYGNFFYMLKAVEIINGIKIQKSATGLRLI